MVRAGTRETHRLDAGGGLQKAAVVTAATAYPIPGTTVIPSPAVDVGRISGMRALHTYAAVD